MYMATIVGELNGDLRGGVTRYAITDDRIERIGIDHLGERLVEIQRIQSFVFGDRLDDGC